MRFKNPTDKIVNVYGKGGHGWYVFKPGQERELPDTEKMNKRAAQNGLILVTEQKKLEPIKETTKPPEMEPTPEPTPKNVKAVAEEVTFV